MTELGIEDISKYLLQAFHEQTKKILLDISIKYSISKDELYIDYLNSDILKNPSYLKKTRKKKNLTTNTQCLCMARKQDGNQCTRRRKDNLEFCGKHINNRKYGRIDDHSNIVDKLAEDDNYIMTWVEEFNGKEYLVDSNDIIYTKDVSSPIIIGKKLTNGTMETLNIY